MKNAWLIGPVMFVTIFLGLLLTWQLMEPAALIRAFDANGYSPVELATLPFFALIVPAVWWLCPFSGSRKRKVVFCLAVSIVAIMAIVKEMDLHNLVLHTLYPNIVGDNGSICASAGLVKPNGDHLVGTPFKMRVLTNAGVPVGMKAAIALYFTLFFGVFAVGFAALAAEWIKGVFRLAPAAWAWGCAGASGVVVQISDRLPAWLDHAHGLSRSGADGVTMAASLCTCLEEGGELALAILALTTVILAAKFPRH